jgi:hypothetical protein
MMTQGERTLVLAAFEQREQAEAVIDELRQAGFQGGDVGLAIPGGKVSEGGPRTGTVGQGEPGAVIGGVTWGGAPGGYIPGLGVVVASGVLSTLLTGAATGTVSSLHDDLIDKGLPESTASFYDQRFREGKTILAVRAGERRGEVESMVRHQHGTMA